MAYNFTINTNDLINREKLIGKSIYVVVETDSGSIGLSGYICEAEADIIRVVFEGLGLGDVQDPLKNVSMILEGESTIIPLCPCGNGEIGQRSSLSTARVPQFEDFIYDVPWSTAYSIGTGVDAVTNRTYGSAVNVTKSSPKANVGISDEMSFDIISSSSEMTRYLQTELDGKYTVKDMSFSSGFDYLKSVKYSEKSLSVILKKQVLEEIYPAGYELELTKEALESLNTEEGRQHFRNVYGDYFVSDERKGAYFIAVYNCTANSMENLSSFKAELTTISKVLDVSTQTKFEKMLKEYGINLNIQVYMHGTKGVMPYPDIKNITDLRNALQWFSENTELIPFYIKLSHYSCLSKRISNAIPYDTDLLLKIKALYSDLWKLYADVQMIHKNYEKEKTAALDLYNEAMLNLQKIIAEEGYRVACHQQIRALREEVQNILDAYKIYLQLEKRKKDEPKPFEKNRTDEKRRVVWEYGVFNHRLIEKKTDNVKESYHTAKYNAKTFIINTAGKTIVGYRLISNWTDGTNGDWWKLSDHGLLDHEIRIHISSYLSRGYDWTFEYYTIEDKYMNFAN